jgi:hypothetical protein
LATSKKEYADKRLAFFEASANAWMQTAMELDRSLLTLSVAGLGLLITLLTTHSGPNPKWLVIFYIISIVCFALCTLAVLAVFHQNKAVILEVLNLQEADQEGPAQGPAQQIAGRLDWVVRITFLVGALSLAVVAIALALQSRGESCMSDKKTPRVVIAADSFNGILNLSPDRVSKSLNGLANLAPKPSGKPTGSASQPKPSSNGGATAGSQGSKTTGQSGKPK